MPLFNKTEAELKTKFDKWCYFLKNLESFDSIPAILNEPIFQKAFNTAELAGLSQQQRREYEENLINYWGMKSAIDTAFEEAIEEREIEIATKFISLGLDNQTIAQGTDLTIEQIERLRRRLKGKNN